MKEINKTIEGYNVNGICVGCLNYNRKMFHLDEVNACFKILGNIDVSNDVTIKVCWECLGTIRTTMRFKKQIEKSLDKLLKYSRMDTSLKAPEDLSQFATQRLTVYKIIHVDSYPCIKDENKITSVKKEPEDCGTDESGLDHDHAMPQVRNSQPNVNPDSVSLSNVVKLSNLPNTHTHTFVNQENESHNSTQRLNIDKTTLPSHPKQEDENKIVNVYVKQEPQDVRNYFDESGLDIEVEGCELGDSNYQDDDLSSEPVTSEDDMPLLKPQSGPNAWKIELQGNMLHLSYTEKEACKTPHSSTGSNHLQFKSDGQQRRVKTNAERQRAYRLRQKQRRLEQRRAIFQKYSSETGERSTDISDTFLLPKPPKKTGAERQRDYRIRIKQALNENGEKPCKKLTAAIRQNGDVSCLLPKPKKTNADRQREFRMRQKQEQKMWETIQKGES